MYINRLTEDLPRFICYLAREKAGVSVTLLMKELKISSSGVSRLVVRGERINANK